MTDKKNKQKELDKLKETMWNLWRYFCEPALTARERAKLNRSKCVQLTNSDDLGIMKMEDTISKIKIQSKVMDGKRTWGIYIDEDSPILKVVDDRDGLK